jgi:hypothetical protein
MSHPVTGSTWLICTNSSGVPYGSGRKRKGFITLNTVVFAAIPNARVNTTSPAYPGAVRRVRAAYLRSCRSSSNDIALLSPRPLRVWISAQYLRV